MRDGRLGTDRRAYHSGFTRERTEAPAGRDAILSSANRPVTTAVIPNRPVFRSQEVCEIAEVQPYVLRSWEAEFPDLGVAKSGGVRVYRRADVERVLRIKQLVFGDGLTLAGARKQLGTENVQRIDESVTDADVVAMLDNTVRQNLRDVRRGLQGILDVLGGHAGSGNGGMSLAVGSNSGRPLRIVGDRSARRPAAAPARAKGKAVRKARRRR